jgi:hypothetical protein
MCHHTDYDWEQHFHHEPQRSWHHPYHMSWAVKGIEERLAELEKADK